MTPKSDETHDAACPDCETNGLGFGRLYRYFRSGGFYRYNPRSRREAARLAWAYSRKARHAR